MEIKNARKFDVFLVSAISESVGAAVHFQSTHVSFSQLAIIFRI